ncbi:MAG: ROK family transcriptional regulator [Candidatus Planktophila sp.]|nr:ROK family transcriptional regulator [Candidatus Planktophila sp.]
MRDSANEVLRAIATSGPLSRAQIARDLSLSGPTLTQATKYLIARGLICELEQSPSTGGRPATLLGLVAGAGQVIGIKLAEDHLVGVVVDLESNVQWNFEEVFNSRGSDAINLLSKILLKHSKKVKGQILGIGIGVPGVVSPGDSGTTDSAILGWSSVNVGQLLSEILKTPVLLENDVNTLSITESLYGRGRDVSNFLTITLGRGIGLGIVINGELYTGSHGAGEIGHVTSVANGLLCECGKRGCLETVASDPAILSRAISDGVLPKNADITKLWDLARKDVKVATKYFKPAGEALSLAIANVVNVFGPELVLISGEGSQAWDIWQKFVLKSLNENVVPTMKKFEIEIDPWDDAKWALGATAIVLQASLSRNHRANASLTEVKHRLSVVSKFGRVS